MGDVPGGTERAVSVDCLAESVPGFICAAAGGEHRCEILECAGQVHRRPGRPVVRDRLTRLRGVAVDQSRAAAAGRGGSGRLALGRGFGLAGAQRGLDQRRRELAAHQERYRLRRELRRDDPGGPVEDDP